MATKTKAKKEEANAPTLPTLEVGQIVDVVATDGGRKYRASVNSGTLDVSEVIPLNVKEKAYKNGKSLLVTSAEVGKETFKEVDKNYVEELVEGTVFDIAFVANSIKYKPRDLFINELKWKYLIRNVIKGKNIIMTGPAGSGKTETAKSVAKVLKKPFYYFNLGATQDPRSSLIGNTFFNKETGTYFNESQFVKAIKTENAVILLDELSRAHPEAWNILMTVLDEGQRYMRLDEKDGQEVIKVAEGVSFIATANIGTEYTSTRVFDRALMDRFSIVEMDVLNHEQELQLLQLLYPTVEVKTLESLAKISDEVRKEWLSSSGKLSTGFSTRMSVQVGEMLSDGFSLFEALEVTLIPLFDQSGGENSERVFVKQIIQKYVEVDEEKDKDLFQTNAKISDDNPF